MKGVAIQGSLRVKDGRLPNNELFAILVSAQAKERDFFSCGCLWRTQPLFSCLFAPSAIALESVIRELSFHGSPFGHIVIVFPPQVCLKSENRISKESTSLTCFLKRSFKSFRGSQEYWVLSSFSEEGGVLCNSKKLYPGNMNSRVIFSYLNSRWRG